MRLRMRLSDLEKNERRKLKHEVFRTQKERSQAFMDLDKRIKKLREEDRDHPCRKCPDVQKHLKWGHRWAREMRELERVQHRYDSRTGSVARQFDHICAVLSNLGYLQPVRESAGHGDYQLTERGQLLRHLYSELDLVLAQAIDDGAFDGLNACELASVVASLVFEARRGGGESRVVTLEAFKGTSPCAQRSLRASMRRLSCYVRITCLRSLANSILASPISSTIGRKVKACRRCCTAPI